MGAYGHRRFNEWLFGGMTRHALEQSRIPLFMRH
jgi:nucleotide-binding universal stress UspA family protein